jgi:hypothetical protein
MDDVTDEYVNDHKLSPNEAEGTVRLSSRSTKGIPPRRLIETCNLTVHEPRDFKEAMAGPDKKWEETIRNRMESLHHYKV